VAIELIIARRFRGPPKSGNGGYVCGRVAGALPGTATVRLKAPPPLEVPLQLSTADGVARLILDNRVIAEGRSSSLDLETPMAPSLAEATVAAADFVGFKDHFFPGCFVCGPGRAVGDGLRIFPGWLADRGVVAAPWTPDRSLADASGSIAPEFLWSALDCTGAFAVLPVPAGRAIVLGELTATLSGSAPVDQPCVAVGWKLSSEGRKSHVGSAVFTADGKLLAAGRATWIEVAASAFGGL
jgi:hypothetical protein